MSGLTKTALTLTLGGLLWAGPGMIGVGAAQDTDMAMLSELRKGEWTVRFRDGTPSRKLCIRSGLELLQLRHSNDDCSRFVVDDDANEVTVQYTCRGNGYGRTHVRKETPILVQIESQGIADGLPFQFTSEARHTGSC